MVRTRLKTGSILVSFLIFSFFTGNATTYPINVILSGSQEVPSNSSAGTATLVGTYNDSTNVLKYTVTFSGLSANTTAAHFHAPAPPGVSAGIVFAATGFPTGVTSGNYTDSIVLSAGQEDTLKRGLWYFNIHTTAFPAGEIRAQIFFKATSFVLPDVHCPANIVVGNDSGICGASVAFVAIDSVANPAESIYYRIGSTSITSPNVFPVGTTTVIVTSLNAAGVDSCSFTVKVNDTQPPVITCPANITAPNDPGVCGAIVNFTATATDNCPGVVITYDHSPGSFFPVGNTTVQAFAADAAGNKDTCTFTVTVNDVEPPVIDSLRTSPRVLWPPNHKMRTVTVGYTATDNCPGPISCQITVTSNQPQHGPGNNHSPDWVIVDDHHIQLRAERNGHGSQRIYTVTVGCTDQHGNSSSADTVVIVPHDMRWSALTGSLHGHGHRTSADNAIIMNEDDPDHSSIVTVFPNPTNSYFNINIEPVGKTDRVSVRLIDLSGRVMEVKDQLYGKQTIQMGQNLRSGYYIVEIRQGDQSKMAKVLKQ